MAGNSLGALFYEIEARTEKLESGLGAAERRLQRFAGVIARAPTAALGAFAAAAALVAVQVARMADQVDQKMRRVGAILGTSTEQITALRREVVAMSREVPQSAAVLAQGLEKIVALGERDPAKAINLLREASRGATVTGQDLNTVIGQLDNILDSFEGREAPEIFDLLTRAGQQGAPAADIAQIVADLGPSAAAARVPLEELVAGITTLLDKGLSTAQATLVLRRGMGGIVTDARNADLAINKLGGEIDVTNGHLVLGGRFAADYRDKLAGLGNAAATAGRVERELNDTLEGQSAILKNQLNAVLINMGTVTLPVVIGLLRTLNTTLDNMVGTIARIELDTAAATITTLGRALERLGGTVRGHPEEYRRLGEALSRFWLDPARATTEQLQIMSQGLRTLARAGQTSFQPVFGPIQQIDEALLRVNNRLRALGAPIRIPVPGATPDRPPPPREPISDEALQRQRAIADEVRSAVAALQTGLVERARRALDELEARVREVFGQRIPDEVRAGLASLEQDFVQLQIAADFTEALEANERAIEQMTRAAKVGTSDWEEQRNVLTGIRDALARNLAEAEAGSAEANRLNALHQRAAQLLERMADAEERKADAINKSVRNRQEELRLLTEQARKIEQGARGAIELARAFGIVDDNAARSLENIAQIAAALPGALSGDFSSLLGVGGGLAGLIDSLFGGGESPEERARREAMQRNTEAIEVLARQIGEFGLDITGSQFFGVRRAVRTGIQVGERVSQVGSAQSAEIFRAMDAALRALGLSMRDLRQVAEELGITIAGTVPTMAELRALLKAIQETELTRFAETFTGQLDALRAEFALFDLDDPITQLQHFRDELAEFSPALQSLFAGLDLTTAEGRAEAERRIQDLFRQMQAGTLTHEQLGGLTGEQFLQALLDLERTIDEANQAVGTSTSFAVDRSITEVTGSRIGALLTTDVFWNEQTALNTKLIAEILGAGQHGPILPPTLDELDRFGDAALTINVTVNLHGTNGNASQLGTEIGQAVAAEIDRELGKRRRAYDRAQGRVSLN